MARLLWIVWGALIAIAMGALGVTTFAGQGTQSVEMPKGMRECEGQRRQICGNWVWNGHSLHARWQNGSNAEITVEQFDAQQVILHRVDHGGATPRMTATYTGKIEGNRAYGTVVWRRGAVGSWSATFAEGPAPAVGPKPQPNAKPPNTKSAASSANPAVKPAQPPAENAPNTKVAATPVQPSCAAPGQTLNAEQAIGKGMNAAHLHQDAVAFLCFLLAAQQGNASAQNDVGFAYEHGAGTKADMVEAAKWYKSAAEQENSFGMWNLGRMYQQGAGVAKDPAEGKKWIDLSGKVRGERTKVCNGEVVRHGMKVTEANSMGDPSGKAMIGLVCLLMGECPDQGTIKLVDAKALDNRTQYGKFEVDSSGKSGAYVCGGLYIRRKAKVKVLEDDDEDGSKELTADAVNGLMKANPYFIEQYRVEPQSDGHYRVTLIPSSLQLTGTYSIVVPEEK